MLVDAVRDLDVLIFPNFCVIIIQKCEVTFGTLCIYHTYITWIFHEFPSFIFYRQSCFFVVNLVLLY